MSRCGVGNNRAGLVWISVALGNKLRRESRRQADQVFLIPLVLFIAWFDLELMLLGIARYLIVEFNLFARSGGRHSSHEVLKEGILDIADLGNLRAGANSFRESRGAGIDRSNHVRHAFLARAAENDNEADNGEDDVHDDARGDDQHALAHRLVAKRARIVFAAVAGLVAIDLADHLHVAAQGKECQLVGRFPPFYVAARNGRTEADAEGGDMNVTPLGCQKMA